MLRSITRRFRFGELQKFNDTFMVGSNAVFIEQLFDKWHKDPTSVPATWDAYFKQTLQEENFEFTPEPVAGS